MVSVSGCHGLLALLNASLWVIRSWQRCAWRPSRLLFPLLYHLKAWRSSTPLSSYLHLSYHPPAANIRTHLSSREVPIPCREDDPHRLHPPRPPPDPHRRPRPMQSPPRPSRLAPPLLPNPTHPHPDQRHHLRQVCSRQR